ncbi:glycosyltransferase [Candidatus Bathyarchaeota archaeon]|nr:glycosyltransferase [Candidatus Bathyarchaeota archaeon]
MIIETILALSAFLIFGFSIIFFLISKFAKPPIIRKDYQYLPNVSIVIPTMNEERIIEKRIHNILNMQYPQEKLEVLFVDNSKDSTNKIISNYEKKYSFLKLIKQERDGFNNALNQGYSMSSGEIVIKSDCTAFPHLNALREIVANFADDSVGAVCGIHVFHDKKAIMEKEFKGIMYKIQLMESYLHSSLISHGSFGAYRKSLIPVLGQEITADDSEVVINVVRNGYRAIIDPEVKIEEEAPKSFKERRSQKNRRAAGVIRVLFKNLNMLFNKKYGKFGTITMPVELFLLVFSPLAIFMLIVLWLYFLVMNQSLTLLALTLVIFCFIFASIMVSAKLRVVVDTYISCFIGIFQSFSRKKTWR